MSREQLDRINQEIEHESDEERLVGDQKWWIAGLPPNQGATFLEDDRALTGSQLSRIRREVAEESDDPERLVGDQKWWIAGLPKRLEPQAGFVEDFEAVAR
jgi:hypothetical protein